MLLENMPVLYVLLMSCGLGFIAAAMGDWVAKYVRRRVESQAQLKQMLKEKDVFEVDEELRTKLEIIERILEKRRKKNKENDD